MAGRLIAREMHFVRHLYQVHFELWQFTVLYAIVLYKSTPPLMCMGPMDLGLEGGCDGSWERVRFSLFFLFKKSKQK